MSRLLFFLVVFWSKLHCGDVKENSCANWKGEFSSFFLLYDKIQNEKVPLGEKEKLLLKIRRIYPKCHKIKRLIFNCSSVVEYMLRREKLLDEWKKEDIKLYERLNKLFVKDSLEYRILIDRVIEGKEYKVLEEEYRVKEELIKEIVSQGIKKLGVSVVEKVYSSKAKLLENVKMLTELLAKRLPECENNIKELKVMLNHR